MPFEERLRKLDLLSLEKTGGPNSSLIVIQGYQEDRASLFSVMCGGKMRDSRHKFKQERFRLVMKKSLFPIEDSPAEAVQRGYAVSTLGCFQDPTEKNPKRTGLIL